MNNISKAIITFLLCIPAAIGLVVFLFSAQYVFFSEGEFVTLVFGLIFGVALTTPAILWYIKGFRKKDTPTIVNLSEQIVKLQKTIEEKS